MNMKIAAASAVAVLWFAGSVHAASITNLDSKDHSFTVIEGDKESNYSIKPSQMVEGICPQGCIVRLNNGDNDEFEFEPEDVVVIEEGQFYLDPSSGAQGDAPPDQDTPQETQEGGKL